MTAQSILSAATNGEADALMRTSSKGVVPHIANLTGVTELLSAKHTDLILNEGLHAHVWTVTAYWPSTPFRDGRALKLALRAVLDGMPGPDGIMPDELWTGEAMAGRVMAVLDCVGVSVVRPEGFEAWVTP